MVTGVRATSQSIAWIGAKIGSFARQGLDVVFPGLEVTGPESVSGLLRGEWDFAQTGTVPVAEAVLNGGDAVIVLCASTRGDPIVVLTRPEITALAQLAGRTVGIPTDACSGQTGVMARLAVEQAGATATYVGLGTYRNILAALSKGEIDAASLPIDFRFVKHGGNCWSCFPVQSSLPTVFATTRRLIADERDLVLRVLRGYIDAVHQFRTRADTIVPLLQVFLECRDSDGVERLHEHYASTLAIVPRPTLPQDMRGLRDLFCQRYPGARHLQEADLIDASLIEELEQSGCFPQL
jgi:ABC-type nitrate/sulfonate/bicarbonate transport system substrate-binding protein